MTTALRYTILSGDTLSAIANGLSACAGIGYQAIAQANPGVNPSALMIGTILNIPGRSGGATVLRYTVMAGDSYAKIASGLSNCTGITYPQIEQANPGLNPSALAIGQVINIPDTVTISPVAPVVTDGENIGFWWWSWGGCPAAPAGTNIAIAFSGWADCDTALQQCSRLHSCLPGSRFIAIGGGSPTTGAFTAASLTALTAAINDGKFSGYDGIAYDVEEGDSGLEDMYAQSFAACKAQGLKVLVTVSHSAPYGIKDAARLMQSFFADANIDYLSPQLYTLGKETENDYATSGGVSWSQYASARAKIIPSIVSANLYANAKQYFQQQGVTLSGFIQWGQP